MKIGSLLFLPVTAIAIIDSKGFFKKRFFFLDSFKTYPIARTTTNLAANDEGNIRVSVLRMLQQSANVETA